MIASCHVIWPDEVPAEMSAHKPSLLEIHYIRAEETGKPRKVLAFYARQAQVEHGRTCERSTKSAWLDGLRMLPQTGRRRSIDVLMTRSDNQGQPAEMAKDDEETDLIVEILTIEIKDPLSRD